MKKTTAKYNTTTHDTRDGIALGEVMDSVWSAGCMFSETVYNDTNDELLNALDCISFAECDKDPESAEDNDSIWNAIDNICAYLNKKPADFVRTDC